MVFKMNSLLIGLLVILGYPAQSISAELKVASYDSSFDLSLAERYVALSGVAYCTNPTFKDDPVKSWTCNACAGFKNFTASPFFNALTDGNGFVGLDHDTNEIVISFSGTNPLSLRNYLDDLDLVKTSYPLCSGCSVHKGFYDTYKAVQSQVLTLLKQYKQLSPSASIAVTGHSLGAALAALCSADLVTSGYSIKTTYSYGMPRVGDDSFEAWYKTVIPGTFRVVHHTDPVPHLPTESIGYHHMPYEVFYVKDYTSWKLCSFDGEDPTCSDQYLVDGNLADHLNYLGFDFTTNWLSC